MWMWMDVLPAEMGRVILPGHTRALRWFFQGISSPFIVQSLLCAEIFTPGRTGGEHKHWDFLAGSVPRKSTRVMSERTSTAWPDPWSAQQDITARQEQGLPTSTRVQRAPTAASPAWQTPGTAGLVLGARSVPGQVGIVCGLNKILICFGSGSE